MPLGWNQKNKGAKKKTGELAAEAEEEWRGVKEEGHRFGKGWSSLPRSALAP